MERFPVPKELNYEEIGIRKELVEGIIELLENAKVTYEEAYETLEATYRTMEYRSKFLKV